LLFFAGAVAFMLVIALPRSAMQAQRVREETLIYRGEQYKRAVQLYFRKYKKYPASLDDLEESDGVRFLRRRYKDPLTGEDEWRLVHMGANGRFKDSVLFDLEKDEEGKEGPEGMQARGAGNRSAPPAAIAASTGAAQNAFRGAELARADRQSAAPDLPGDGPSAAEIMAAGLSAAEPGDGTDGANPANPGEGPNQQAQGEQAPGGAVPYPNYATTLPSQIPSPTGAGALANVPAANNPNAIPPNGQAAARTQAQANPPANQQSSNRRVSNVRGRRGGVMQPGMAAGMA
jgi:hypothetical protein